MRSWINAIDTLRFHSSNVIIVFVRTLCKASQECIREASSSAPAYEIVHAVFRGRFWRVILVELHCSLRNISRRCFLCVRAFSTNIIPNFSIFCVRRNTHCLHCARLSYEFYGICQKWASSLEKILPESLSPTPPPPPVKSAFALLPAAFWTEWLWNVCQINSHRSSVEFYTWLIISCWKWPLDSHSNGNAEIWYISGRFLWKDQRRPLQRPETVSFWAEFKSLLVVWARRQSSGELPLNETAKSWIY